LIEFFEQCEEKIANTYKREAFPPTAPQLYGNTSADVQTNRRYKCHMEKALRTYAEALVEAREVDKKGLVEEQSGGSNHGVSELIYRLHATRLKCLISAVDRKEDEREAAELEAVMLTEQHWRKVPDKAPTNLRDRVWAVLVDVVSALVQCRLDHPFFHRSVYRHAQALMWAPILCDPVGELVNGSFGSVPGTRAVELRGFNSSTPAVDSAVSVIGSLFDKRRSQLCAVWVTNAISPSLFQTINVATRKFDALRGKYISAYLDSLRLYGKKREVETFLRWAMGCRRDLPSYFAASAMAEGGPPRCFHNRDPLLVNNRFLSSFFFLTSVKRHANSALAAVIYDEIESNGPSDKAGENENRLRASYACFLRLNVDPANFIRSHSWRYHCNAGKMGMAGTKDIVEALTAAYLAINPEASRLSSSELADWSGDSQLAGVLRVALADCQSRFPNLSGAYFTTRKSPTKKKRRTSTSSQQDGGSGMVTKSFDVTVPAGLSAGESFEASIPVRGGQHKKVRLTVPDEPAQVMRFSLEVPADEFAPVGASNDDGDAEPPTI